MAVKFLTTAQVGTLYNEGEVAGFDKETEEKLIKAKVAERAKPEKTDAAPAA